MSGEPTSLRVSTRKPGSVIDWLDLSAVAGEAAAAAEPNIDVLNGIAWNPETGTVYRHRKVLADPFRDPR